MKKIKKIVIPIFTILLVVVSLLQVDFKVGATTYDESGLVVNGSHVVVGGTGIENQAGSTNVTFTFKTTDNNYQGFIGGCFVIKFDADRMDIDPSSIKQQGRISGVNTNYTSFQVNGVQGQRGMILVEFSSAVPGQNFDLTMSCINLFKDGSRNPLEIEIINRQEDPLIVMDINDVIYVPSTPIINAATISLDDLGVSITGEESVKKGEESLYVAEVSNYLQSNKVNWRLVGANSPLTVIDQGGKLNVDENETATYIEIVASLQEDTSVMATKRVEISKAEVMEISIVGSPKLIKGTKDNIYNATITNTTNQTVSWIISGNSSKDTKISHDGNLTIGVHEQVDSIDLIATSLADNNIVATKTISLIEKTYTIVAIKLKTNEISIDASQSPQDLEKLVSTNQVATVTIATNDGKTYEIDVPISKHTFDKIVTNEEQLLEGNYVIMYNLKLPYIQIDENEKVTVIDDVTNIIGENTVQIPLTINKKIVTPPPTENKQPPIENKQPPTSNSKNITDIKNKDSVITSDSNEFENNFIVLVNSFVIFMMVLATKSGRKT